MRWPVAVLALALAGCLPNSRSDEFACASQADCASDRICDGGFCIRAECPDDCSSCDLVAKTCTIACLGSGDCDNVQCPDGFDCNVLCMVARACDNVDCSGARSCSVTCLGTTACKDITCGDGP
ncbi:MAG TPA: hypothetical protein VFQ53_13260, partial [Kofleriaceae bacterium]|nr:hypothetical protein [Kofleriaceae bacterium]